MASTDSNSRIKLEPHNMPTGWIIDPKCSCYAVILPTQANKCHACDFYIKSEACAAFRCLCDAAPIVFKVELNDKIQEISETFRAFFAGTGTFRRF